MARILLVDDEEMDRTFGRTVLEDAGHELFYAPNGEVALRTYPMQAIDVVITDLAMPNLNGLRLIQQLRELDDQALIIAVTGVSPEQLERAREMGAAMTLRKPYAPQALLRAVTELLESRIAPPPDDLWR
jgi:CheY-like chemotaxis protein